MNWKRLLKSVGLAIVITAVIAVVLNVLGWLIAEMLWVFFGNQGMTVMGGVLVFALAACIATILYLDGETSLKKE